jgi:hypothetical protein
MPNASSVVLPPYVHRMARNLPDSEVAFVKEGREHMSDTDIRLLLSILRCTSKVCEECGRRPGPGTAEHFFPCTDCFTIHYCSEECQRSHSGAHRGHCGDRHAPRVLGFSETVFTLKN